jgi:hypothetical protein
MSPALRQHVADVAREIFSGERHRSSTTTEPPNPATTNSTSSPFIYDLATLEKDVTSFVDQFEEHLLILDSDSIDGDDSIMSSPGNPNIEVDMLTMGRPFSEDNDTARAGSTIVPVVTYDSDESKHQPIAAWNESRISKNLDETFTLQELDSSFPCWNVMPNGILSSSTLMVKANEVDHIDHVNHTIYTNDMKDIESDTAPTILSPSNKTAVPALPFVEGPGIALNLSPSNLKEIVRRLPDSTEIMNVLPVASSSRSLERSGTNDIVETDQGETTGSCINSTVRSNSAETSTEICRPVVTQQEKHVTSTQQQQQRISNRRRRRPNIATEDHPPSNSVMVWHWSCGIIPSQYDRSVSAGSGLYTERGTYPDVAWERRLRL